MDFPPRGDDVLSGLLLSSFWECYPSKILSETDDTTHLSHVNKLICLDILVRESDNVTQKI